jgi:hypothetical protein
MKTIHGFAGFAGLRNLINSSGGLDNFRAIRWLLLLVDELTFCFISIGILLRRNLWSPTSNICRRRISVSEYLEIVRRIYIAILLG